MENVYGLAYRNQTLESSGASSVESETPDTAFPGESFLPLTMAYRSYDSGSSALGSDQMCWMSSLSSGRSNGRHQRNSGPHETRTGWDEHLEPHVTSGRRSSDSVSTRTLSSPKRSSTEPMPTSCSRSHRGRTTWDPWTAERGHSAPRFKWRSRYWSFLLKLDPQRPSPTIQGSQAPGSAPFTGRTDGSGLRRLSAL